MKYTKETFKSNEKIEEIKKIFDSYDAVLIGVGAGFTAAEGVNYMDENLCKKWFPEYYKLGMKNIMEIQSKYWRVQYSVPEEYYSYWSKHIYKIRYQLDAFDSYKNIYEIFKDKNAFIITTNVDGQLEKAGFDKNIIFGPQGDYKYFQCKVPCSDALYDNKEMVYNMVTDPEDEYRIKSKYIPHCPNCGEYLIPNLRVDDTYVEKPHLFNYEDYKNFIRDNKEKKIAFLEIGVGFNTPGIIRFPFEQMTKEYKDAKLIRINANDTSLYLDISKKSILMKEDVKLVLEELIEDYK